MKLSLGQKVKVIGDAEFHGQVGEVIEFIEGWDYPVNVWFDTDGAALLYAEDELEAVK